MSQPHNPSHTAGCHCHESHSQPQDFDLAFFDSLSQNEESLQFCLFRLNIPNLPENDHCFFSLLPFFWCHVPPNQWTCYPSECLLCKIDWIRGGFGVSNFLPVIASPPVGLSLIPWREIETFLCQPTKKKDGVRRSGCRNGDLGMRMIQAFHSGPAGDRFPVWLLLFPEGTTVHEEYIAKSQAFAKQSGRPGHAGVP